MIKADNMRMSLEIGGKSGLKKPYPEAKCMETKLQGQKGWPPRMSLGIGMKGELKQLGQNLAMTFRTMKGQITAKLFHLRGRSMLHHLMISTMTQCIPIATRTVNYPHMS